MKEIGPDEDRFRSYASRLLEFEFEHLGLLGKISSTPYQTALYAFVALQEIADDSGGKRLNNWNYIAPNEIF
jgi:hypothetical protein